MYNHLDQYQLNKRIFIERSSIQMIPSKNSHKYHSEYGYNSQGCATDRKNLKYVVTRNYVSTKMTGSK